MQPDTNRMKTMWDQRYAAETFVYGKDPNEFFRERLLNMRPGKILFPAEGEGRNAVFAARKGWQVVAFDNSVEARKKAMKLAAEWNVKIDYRLLSYNDFDSAEEEFDVVAFIYAHVPGNMRQPMHQKMIRFLKPGGVVILEGFSKQQLEKQTGGPKNIDFLFSREELQDDFKSLSEISITEKETELKEGEFHRGLSSIIRLVGRK